MPRVAIDILLKHEILDPEGRAVQRALPDLGFEGITDVRVGKHIELDLDAPDGQVEATVEKLCADFLANPVIESWKWRVVEPAERPDA
jgi:phosphoribosylformylglycinamidine synthase